MLEIANGLERDAPLAPEAGTEVVGPSAGVNGSDSEEQTRCGCGQPPCDFTEWIHLMWNAGADENGEPDEEQHEPACQRQTCLVNKEVEVMQRKHPHHEKTQPCAEQQQCKQRDRPPVPAAQEKEWPERPHVAD